METIKLKIKELLKLKNWTIATLSTKISSSRQNTYNIVNGEQKISLETLMELSNVFGVPMAYWFDQEETLVNRVTDVDGEYQGFLYQAKQIIKELRYIIDEKEKLIKAKDKEIAELKSKLSL
jgi:transcriptional regulator with XRE-family HTH domain